MITLHGKHRLSLFMGLSILGAVLGPAAPGAAFASTGCVSAWTIVPSPNTSRSYDTLVDVSVLSAGDIWAVGSAFNPGSPAGDALIEHWNGTRWQLVRSPHRDGVVISLGGVAALSSTDVWAVGSVQQAGGGPARTLSEHWDGTRWTIVPSPNVIIPGPYPTTNGLAAVSAVSASDVWAVGSASTIVAGQTVAMHWDGSSWRVVQTPNPGFYSNALYDVAAIAVNDVWAIGDKVSLEDHNMALHWDGTAWSVVSTPAFHGTNVDTLTSISAVSATDIWAAGTWTIPDPEGAIYQTATMHWDGSAWRIVDSPNPGARNNFLFDVVAVSSSEAWAVGSLESSVYKTLTLRWDGATWSVVDSPNASIYSNQLFGVDAVAPGDIWSVGNTTDNVRSQTLTEHFTGACGG